MSLKKVGCDDKIFDLDEKLGAQCGFCTPGMVMAAEGLLRENADPSEGEIRRGMAANICRCTGYVKIIESVQSAAAELSGAKQSDRGDGA